MLKTYFITIQIQILAQQCSKLQEVHFCDTALSDENLEIFVKNNGGTLRVINLQGCHTLTGTSLRTFEYCSESLEDLSLYGCHNVDISSIECVVQQCQSIKRLNLRYCHKVNDKYV